MEQIIHTPVLWREVLDYINNSPFKGTGTFIDATLGEGGHSELILQNFDNIRVVAFDRDEEILQKAKNRLKTFGNRFETINDNFSNMNTYIQSNSVNFILYDFGISSYHYESNRGFTFSKEEKLDMRLDKSCSTTAEEVVNTLLEKDLNNIFFHLGEERWAKRVAKVICEKRKEEKIETTKQLADIVLKAIPKRFHVRNIHPATRVFQGIRIYINDELQAIEDALKDSYKMLHPGGRIFAISFHSLEDRLVKRQFKKLADGCLCGLDGKHCMCHNKPFIKILTKKPIVPGELEIAENNRARSSKLRICERV